MNIFFLDTDLKLNAQYYCDKHVVKMLVEYAQLMSTCNRLSGLDEGYKISHRNNPLALWVSESLTNWRYLKIMSFHLHEEFKYRYYHDHKSWHLINSLSIPNILDKGLTVPPLCMPDCCKMDNVIKAYRFYYALGKNEIVSWRGRPIPKWYIDMREMIEKTTDYNLMRKEIQTNELFDTD